MGVIEGGMGGAAASPFGGGMGGGMMGGFRGGRGGANFVNQNENSAAFGGRRIRLRVWRRITLMRS